MSSTSSITRLTGMASGLDTDTLVKQLMKAENTKLDKAKQSRQLLQWKQDMYRDISSSLISLKNTYFNVLNSSTNMLSTNSYSSFDVTSSDTTNSIVTASGSADAAAGVYTVKNVTIAQKASYKGNSVQNVKEATNLASFPISSTEMTGLESVTIKVNGTDYKIDLSKSYGSLTSLADDINNKLKTYKVDGKETDITKKVTAQLSSDGMQLIFKATDGNTLDGTYKADGTTAIENNTLTFNAIKAGVNDTLKININGTITPITLASDKKYNNITELVNEVNSKLDAAHLGPTDGQKLKAQVSLDGTKIQFVNISSDDSTQVSVTGSASGALGFSSTGFYVYPSSSDRMSSLFNDDTVAKVKFTINGKDFSYDFSSTGADKDKSISQVLSEISSKAGVNLKYSELGKVFSVESLTTGASESVTITNTSGAFIKTLFGTDSTGNPLTTKTVSGSDATLTITDPSGSTATVNKATNSFSIDGVTYNLLKDDASASGIKLTLTQNPQKIYDKIKTFIDKYNEVIGTINTKVDEKKLSDYTPLTDDQKKDMSEDQIKKWEEKAKQGLLKNDSDLQNMVYSLRTAFYTPVKDVGISLSDIGLSTSSDTTQRGKIIIDETKLKAAIQNNGKQVMDLFTKTSTSQSSYSPNMTSTERTTRTNEEGIFQRISDYLQDNIRTNRNNSGQKGYLIEKAGIVGDYTQYNNLLSTQLDEKDKLIKKITTSLAEKETQYYNKFAKLESVMSQLNSQSSWLTQQMSSMS